MELISRFFGASDSIPIPYHPRGTSDRRRRLQNGFYTPASPITLSVEEFMSP